jgi:hypothetical protein
MSENTLIQRSFAAFPLLTLLGACASDVVDLGGGNVAQNLERGIRCNESSVIGESVRIESQEELDALLGCEEIRGDLVIDIFPGTDLSPLASLRAVGGTFILGANTRRSGFADPELEAAALDFDRVQQIVEAGWLGSLQGVESLERVGSLIINGIAAPNLQAFERLQNVGSHQQRSEAGRVRLSDAQNLIDLSGLESATGLGSLEIEGNPALRSLKGLQVGTELETVFLRDDPSLSDLGALAPVEVVSEVLYLYNIGAQDLDALVNLRFLGGGIALVENARLTDVSRLGALEGAQSLVFERNPKLESLPEFSSLESIDTFKALGNPELQAIALSFPALVRSNLVQDELVPISANVIEIGGNEGLRSVALPSGFEAAQVFAIYGNSSLESLDFGSLQRLDRLSIDGHPSLADVSLGALRTVDRLSVSNNPQLSAATFSGVRTFASELVGNANAAAP